MNLLISALLIASIEAFSTLSVRDHLLLEKTTLHISEGPSDSHSIDEIDTFCNIKEYNNAYHSRRSILNLSLMASSLVITAATPTASIAKIGTLPEYEDTNNILQGITIRVADQSQQQAMIKFLEDGFDCEVLRKRITGSVEETWLGFGPEELKIPSDFQLPVSSFSKYGGHSSIHLVYDAKETTPFYRSGEDAPGNNIAYLQLGVPTYRVTQMVKNGGNIIDAYGIVNVVSPSGLPIRGIVGIAPDPIMFVAINCVDVKKSQTFYEQLGFVQQEYPYCRPNKGLGQFEPIQPEKSIYMAPTANGMGILLLKSKEKKITPNTAVESLNLVYNPTVTETTDDNSIDDEANNIMSKIFDPSAVGITFKSVSDFEAEERTTR